MIINRLPALTIANVSKPAKITGQPGDLISFPARCDNRTEISWLRPADRSRYRGCGLIFLILDNLRRNLASDNGRRPHLSPDGETTDQANFNTSSPIPITNPGGGIIERKIHLSKGSNLFKRSAPSLTSPHHGATSPRRNLTTAHCARALRV